MAIEPRPPTYTSQNFEAVNDYVGHLADRHRARSASWRSETFGTYAKWTSAIVAAGGISAFLVLFGLSLLKEKPEPRIVAPVVVDRPVTINLPEGIGRPNQESEVDHLRREAVSRIDKIKAPRTAPERPDSTPIAKTVIDYVMFKEISFGRSGINKVTVGMRYKDSSTKKPSRQWCYVSKTNLSGSVTRVNLAAKIADRRTDYTLTLNEAREIRSTMADLKVAQRSCAFE